MGVQALPYEIHGNRRIEAVSKIFQQKIQLPSVVRNSLNLKDGEKIVWVVQDGKWFVEKA